MKKIIIFAVLGLFLVSNAYAELTKKDIEEIRNIIKEEVQGSAQETNIKIDGLRQEMNIKIDGLKQEMNTKIDGLRQEMNTKIDNVNIRLDSLQSLLYVILAGMFALVGFVLWDRKTALAPAIKKTIELEEREEKIEKVLKEYALQEPRLASVLKQTGI